MQITFTKMQGAGNDFVVLDETRARLKLGPAQYRWLADRHFGVGADQILSVRPAPQEQAQCVDFEYVIHNSDGHQVEQCGNGSRCFARYVYDKGLTSKTSIRVHTLAGIIEPSLQADGRVRVNMGRPRFAPAQIPFDTSGLTHEPAGALTRWRLPLEAKGSAAVWLTVVSMGNPHAVQIVDSTEAAAVAQIGPAIEQHERFVDRVNVAFMQIEQPGRIALRVYERGAGETLACGTGACAAAVAGMGMGLLAPRVDVQTRGGLLTIEWAGNTSDVVWMTGPAVTVFEGTIDIPDNL